MQISPCFIHSDILSKKLLSHNDRQKMLYMHERILCMNEASVSFRKLRGSLKICSRSIIFDPDDFEEPILKVYLKQS